MNEPIAYLNGELLPISKTAVSVFDLGLVQGAAVTEMVRTFAHKPFRLDDHLDRLHRSLKAVGFSPVPTASEIEHIVCQVSDHNGKLIPPHHDLGIVIFITPGQNLTYVGSAGAEWARVPTVCVHTFSLPFELWAEKLVSGQHLVTPSIRQISPDTLDPKIKSRSRLHWHLADRQARLVDGTAGALLLDQNGFVTETSSGNFFILEKNTLYTPASRDTLGGVSQQVVSELANELDFEYCPEELRVYDVLNADEAFTSSTPYCVLSVTKLNGTPIGEERPGPTFRKMMDAWSRLVGLDIVKQMTEVAAERQSSAERTGSS